jgi:hypothetical protein
MHSRQITCLLLNLQLLLATITQSALAQESTPPQQFPNAHPEILFTGQPGQWDAKIRERGWILREGNQWRMWYTGYNPDIQPLVMKLGLATSHDGIHWKRSTQNPLVDQFWVEDMMIVRHQHRYYMFAEGLNDQTQLLSSPDGVQWTRIGTLDVRLTDGQPIPPGPFGTPSAFCENGVWNLLYERKDLGVWLARSTDMQVWTNVSDQPVLTPGPAEFDSRMLALNQIQKINGRYIAVLHGTGDEQKPRRWATYTAESSDLLSWTKSNSPLRPVSENKSSGLLLFDGDRWRFYTTHDKVELHWAADSPVHNQR